MVDIVAFMKNQSDFYAMNGTPEKDILLAEQLLGLKFAKDYREYVSEFGAASFDGHELTGVCKSKRLDVVNVTQSQRTTNTTVQSDGYVIEQANFDNITIWQDSNGTIYSSQSGARPQKIASNLADYLGL